MQAKTNALPIESINTLVYFIFSIEYKLNWEYNEQSKTNVTYLHSDDSINEEQHGDQQTYVG